jgi:hypothetical protein
MSERVLFEVESSDEWIVRVDQHIPNSNFTVQTNKRIVEVNLSDEERWGLNNEG